MSTPTTDEAAARLIIDGILAAGWHLDRVFDEDGYTSVDTTEDALTAVFAVDMAYVYFQHPITDQIGWVCFVLGNDPEEVAADYTVSLESAIDPITREW